MLLHYVDIGHFADASGLGTGDCYCKNDSTYSGNHVRALARIGGQIEAGSGLDEDGRRTRSADILVHNWEFYKPAALDFTITSPLNHSTLNEASVMAGSAASAAELRKHTTNDEKCNRLGWVCIPLSVETYIRLLGRGSQQVF